MTQAEQQRRQNDARHVSLHWVADGVWVQRHMTWWGGARWSAGATFTINTAGADHRPLSAVTTHCSAVKLSAQIISTLLCSALLHYFLCQPGSWAAGQTFNQTARNASQTHSQRDTQSKERAAPQHAPVHLRLAALCRLSICKLHTGSTPGLATHTLLKEPTRHDTDTALLILRRGSLVLC